MNFEKIIIDCIRHSPDISAKSAAQFIGVSSTLFGRWRRYQETRQFPTADHLPKIAELSGHKLQVVVFSYLSAKSENPATSKTYETLAA